MNKLLRYSLQAFNYTLFMAMVWYFSIMPPYHQLDEDQAVVTLSFSHSSELRSACKRLTQEEMNKMPPNKRVPTTCPRERSPVSVELYLNNELMTKQVVIPPGIHQDQGIDLFHRTKVTAGDYQLRVVMNDDVKVAGATYQFEQVITLLPEQQLLLDFDAESGGFYIN